MQEPPPWSGGGSLGTRYGCSGVSGLRSRVRKRLACDRNELPVVAVGVKGEFQDAEGAGTAHLRVGADRAHGPLSSAAGADDEFTDAGGISDGSRRLQGEALVIMVVAVDDQVGMGRVQVVPPGSVGSVVAMGATRAEGRDVPDGDDVLADIGRQIGLEEGFLRRADATAAYLTAQGVE